MDISVAYLSTLTSLPVPGRPGTGKAPQSNTCEKKNAKHLQDGVRFPKLVWMQCVSFLIGSVRGRLTTQLQP